MLVGWFSCLTIFNGKKNHSVELGPASHGEGRRKRLASYLLKCWKPPSHSARQRNGLCPVLVRDVCTFSRHRIFCPSKGFWTLWTKRWSKATRAFPTALSQPARSAFWMRIWETPKSPFLWLFWSPSQINLRSSVMQESSCLVGGDGQQQAHVRSGHLENRHSQPCERIKVWDAIKPFGAKVLDNEEALVLESVL